MEIVRKIPVTLDFRQVTKIPMPQINQFDSNVFEFTIVDNGEAADLSNVERIVGNYRRPDKTVVSRSLTHAANVIEYPLGAEEMAQQGMGELNVQLFDASKRLSSITIKVYLHDNLGADLETSEGMTLLQEIFVEVSDLAVEAQSAATYAKNQGDYAKEQAEKAGDLEGVKDEVVAAATKAEAQATFAKTQGDYAKEQADLSAEQYERLKDTDVGTLSAQLADKVPLANLGLKKNIMDFGIDNKGVQPTRDIIQRAEDEASSLATSLGIRIALEFPLGVYMVERTINKRSNVDWIGQGTLIRNPANQNDLYALVLGDNVSNFLISGMSFSNLPHHIAHSLTGSWSKSTRNCCMHFYSSSNFTVDNCSFTNYSEGLVRTGCKKYRITNNNFNSNVNGKSVNQFLDDSYVSIAGSQTGDITGWVLQNEANKYDEDFIISGNQCLSVGLRIGIETMTQAATHARGIISNNIIKGLHQGIKLYKGTYGILENAITNVKQTLITGNQVSYCLEAGIYIRANIGVLCAANYVSYCGLFNTGNGAAYGGILTRISAEVTDVNSSLEAGSAILNNYVYNSGKSIGNPVDPIGIHCRNANAFISANMIVQDSLWTSKKGVGIFVGLGDNAESFDIHENKITNFNKGISIQNTLITTGDKGGVVKNNIIRAVNQGIEIFLSNDTWVDGNRIYNFSEIGVSIRNSTNTVLVRNSLKTGVDGVIIYNGTFLDNTNRTNPSNKVFQNVFENVNVPFTIRETATGDTTFAGRCKYFADNLVDWVKVP